MNNSEEYQKYLESQVVMKQYGIKGYSTGSSDSGSKEENTAL